MKKYVCLALLLNIVSSLNSHAETRAERALRFSLEAEKTSKIEESKPKVILISDRNSDSYVIAQCLVAGIITVSSVMYIKFLYGFGDQLRSAAGNVKK